MRWDLYYRYLGGQAATGHLGMVQFLDLRRRRQR